MSSILYFEQFAIDATLCELRRSGATVAIQPKVFKLLLYLAERRDRVVPKEELFDALWPGESVGNCSLTRAVRVARLALGDRGDSQRMIRTIRGFGYRFVGEVHEQAPDQVRRGKSLFRPCVAGQSTLSAACHSYRYPRPVDMYRRLGSRVPRSFRFERPRP
jgi:DNA-binding winged helix-turn-helix (wHTH) protein